MKKLQEKLATVKVEKLEERKEFTFYLCYNPCNNPCHTHTPTCGGEPGTGGGGTND